MSPSWPGPPESSTTVIACCSDSSPPVFARVVRAIAQRSPDLILFAGDARADGFGIGRWRETRWRRTWGPLAGRVVTVPGNHDYAPGAARPWTWSGSWDRDRRFRRCDTSGAFVLHLPDVSVVGLDCGPRAFSVSAPQIAWLRTEMASAPPASHRIAVFHAPAFPAGNHIGSSLDARPLDRDVLWSALEDAGVALVVNGHEHLYARRTITVRTPIVQVITAGAGAGLSPVITAEVEVGHSRHHAVVLTAGAGALFMEAFTPDGVILDRHRFSPPVT